MKKNTRILIIIIAAVLLIAGTITGLYIRKTILDRTVNIAFYGLSEDKIELIKEQLPVSEKIIIKYDVLAPGAIELGVISKKYDMLFTWKGEVTDALEGSIETIPGKLLDNIPISLRNKYCFPLLLDHYEIDLYQPAFEKTEINTIETYNDFENYLTESTKYYFSPFFCMGSNDRTLLALIGTIVEAKGGVPAYKKLIEAMRKASSLDEFADVSLDNNGLTFRSVLDELKTWPEKGITHPQWFRANGSDVQIFAEEKQVASLFMSLSEHREFSYRIISEYKTYSMPGNNEDLAHGIIAPAICALLISDNANCKNYLKALVNVDVQSYMSNKTMLGPVQYRAEAYDIQADDVRFWAASCAGGALPDLSLAVYQRKPDLQTSVAAEIRSYLK